MSGGWTSNFTTQTGASIIDGEYGVSGSYKNNNGILITGGIISFDRFVIQNSTSGNGGGIYNTGGSLTLTNSTVRNNHAGNGAGIFLINNASLSLLNVTVSNNSSTGNGSGIYATSPTTGTHIIKYSTIAYNSASISGGGMFLPATGTTITDSIIANNIAPIKLDCSGTINTSNHNIIGNTTGCTVTAGAGDLFNVNPQIDPSLTGSLPVHALLSNSPAINTGNLTGCPSTDEIGTSRPQGAACDIGAFEITDSGIIHTIGVSSGNNQQKATTQPYDNPLAVLVSDFYGNPSSGVSVTFTAPASGASGTFASTGNNTETVTTNASGIAASSTFTANGVVGFYSVSAVINGAGTYANFSLQNLPGPGMPFSFTILSGNNQQKPINQAYDFPFSVKVMDSLGNPVPSGINVTFTAPTSGASGTFVSNHNRIEIVTTIASGVATSSTFTANGTTGSFTVIVSVQDIATTANISLNNVYAPGVPTSIVSVSGSNQQKPVNQAFGNPLVARVRDGLGNVVSGASVTFTAPASGASATFASSGTNVETVLTDANGLATSSLITANGIVGSYIVKAATSGVVSQSTYQLQNQYAPGVPQTINIISGNDQVALTNNAFTNPLTVRVLDGYGTAVSGINVTFTAPATGASGTFTSNGANTETAVTNATGNATSSIFTANSIWGAYSVSVTVVETSSSVSFSLGNIGYRYVKSAIDGGIDTGECSQPASACATINYAISKALPGDTIYVATGKYTSTSGTEVVTISKNITLSGGWDPGTFSIQVGASTIDGEKARGGVYISGVTVTINHFIIQNGYSNYPAGIRGGGNLTLNNDSVINNESTGSTGGISIAGPLYLNNSTVGGNKASSIGGILVDVGTGNSATIKNSTIANNIATNSSTGGIFVSYQSTVHIENTLIANNSSKDCAGTTTTFFSSGYNIIGNLGSCQITPTTGDKFNIDPLLESMAIGTTGYYPLFANSPAIDSGNPASCLSTDQRGLNRLSNGKCDIGAYEYSIPGPAAFLGIMNGANQRGVPYQNLSLPFKLYVVDNLGSPVSNQTVTFTSPLSGPSGIFNDTNTNVSSATTNSNGVVTSASFTSNIQPGSFNVTASINGLSVDYPVTNVSWYVSPTGNDSNTCSTPATSCLTINNAVTKAQPGDIIFVASGVYYGTSTSVISIGKGITISGGWNSTFTTQSGYTTVDGQDSRNGIIISAASSSGQVVIERFVVQNGYGATGAGIYASNGTTAIIKNSLIKGNHSTGNGGGIGAATANLVLTNVTISGNTADAKGGGLYFDSYYNLMTLNVNYATIADNTSSDGGGVYFRVAGITGERKVQNTIITRNTAPTGPNCSGTISITSHNFINNPAGCTVLSGDNYQEDPKISATLIGVPGYYSFVGISPAIDTGDPVVCPATDQRGVARPIGSGCDIGAFERATVTGVPDSMIIYAGGYQRTDPGHAFSIPFAIYLSTSAGDAVSGINVTFTAPASGVSGTFTNTGTNSTTVISDSNGIATASIFTANAIHGDYNVVASASGLSPVTYNLQNIAMYVNRSGQDTTNCTSPAQPCYSINYAISQAVAGDHIFVTGEIYDGALSSDSLVHITKNIFLSGGWNQSFTAQTSQTVLNLTSGRGIYVVPGSSAGIDRFDVRGGNLVNNFGGGILNSGSLTFINGAIYNNTVHGVFTTGTPPDTTKISSDGGGIYSNGTQLILTNVTISNNQADTGGGIFVYSGATTLNNVTITQNFATNVGVTAYGGGIENKNNSPIAVKNSIIAGNAAEVGQDCYKSITSGGNNLIGYDAGCDITPASGDLIGHGNPLNAKLGDLGDNSSNTKTHALLIGSPAIDTGNPITCAPKDQRGIARPQGSACDMGAFEGSTTQTITVNAKTYSAENSQKWPGTFLCDQTSPNCTNNSDSTADTVQQLAIDTYNFYLSTHNRNSIDNNNMPIVSTVHYCSTTYCPYPNAFWTGAQMVYGDAYGFANADDIVAHELTHGVTQYESNLYYFYQSGAINESFSDLWGEYFDQMNGLGNDTPEVKWLLGEDLTGWTNPAPQPPLGQRSLSDPTVFEDPDMMTSPLYVKTPEDSGGVHSNSGVNNKAVYLMVDGGTFNGKTVTGIGWDKTAAIYYEANANLLTSASDYSDLYYALQQACANLVGQKGIVSNDCKQVKNAIDAVQMNSLPVANFTVEAPLCPAGMTTGSAVTLFQDNFENGLNNWETYANQKWSLSDFYAASPTHMMWGDDVTTQHTDSLLMKNFISIPPGSTTFLYFKHAFAFEFDSDGYYDGAVLEYGTNGDLYIFTDAKTLFSAGQNYNGTVFKYPSGYENYGSYLQGRTAFVGDSHGYVSSRYNLSSLAGKTVRFRWQYATDYSGYYQGWFMDDVSIYQCVGTPAIPTLQAPANNFLSNDYTPYLNWTDTSPSLHHYQVQIATDGSFIPASIVLDQNNLPTSEFTVPTDLAPDTTFYWRVRALNAVEGSLGWSSTWTFRTVMLPPALTWPAQSEHVFSLRPTFDWENVPNATGYTIQISTTNTFTAPIVGNPTLSTFTPATDLPIGVLYWRVLTKGYNGPSAWSEVRSYNGPNPPPAPSLGSPMNNRQIFNLAGAAPTFSWREVSMPAGTTFKHYQFQLGTSADFATHLVDVTLTATNYHPSISVTSNTNYYWRVRAVNTVDEPSPWSDIWSLSIPPKTPNLLTPVNSAQTISLRPIFEWSLVESAGYYTIQISRDSTFTQLVTNSTSSSSTFTAPKDLPPSTTLYWRVRAEGSGGSGAWSPVLKFLTPNPPGVPVLISPAMNAVTAEYQPVFTWNLGNLPRGTTFDHSQLQVSSDPGFSTLVIDQNIMNSSIRKYSPDVALSPNTQYYWRVRAFNTDGEMSSWAEVHSFQTRALVPASDRLGTYSLDPNLPSPGSVSPSDHGTTNPLLPGLDWTDVANATSYIVQVSNDPAFTSSAFIVSATTIDSDYEFYKNVPNGATLYWRVLTVSTDKMSSWSPVYMLQIP